MNERRKGQHKAVHRLAQVYADLLLAEKELLHIEDSERRHRALCFVRDAATVIRHIVDNDLGKQLIGDANG